MPSLDERLLLYRDRYRACAPSGDQEVIVGIVLRIVRRFHEAGGVVGLGTDWSVGTGVEAGIPLGEMEMLLAAGLTPMEVIEAGTRHAATACGHAGELGTLAPGMLADIIVVGGDPLQDLQALGQVLLVIKNGESVVISDGMLSVAE